MTCSKNVPLCQTGSDAHSAGFVARFCKSTAVSFPKSLTRQQSRSLRSSRRARGVIIPREAQLTETLTDTSLLFGTEAPYLSVGRKLTVPGRSHKKCQVSRGQIQPCKNHLFAHTRFFLKINYKPAFKLGRRRVDFAGKSRFLASVSGWESGPGPRWQRKQEPSSLLL